MEDIRVRLSWTEILLAADVGIMRNVQSLRGRWTPSAEQGFENSWTPNIEGAAGEMAVAKYLAVYWGGIVGDPKADDVGEYQVRTNASRRLDDMILRPGDRKDRIWISVLSFLPEFVICGWIAGRDGMNSKYLRQGTPGRPDCYFVPRSALQPMRLLPLKSRELA